MNAQQAKQVPIEKVFAHYGYYPAKVTTKEIFYRIDQNDKNPSLSISPEKNVWKNWQTGEAGNVIDFVMYKNHCDFKEALSYMDNHFKNEIVNFNRAVNNLSATLERRTSYTIDEVKPLENRALVNYLKNRKIDETVAKEYCKEIYWTNANGKKLYAVGFENIAEGYEVRNSFYKGNLKTKQISYINNQSNTVKIFEGFIDFLSYASKNSNYHNSDYVVLNSVTMVQQLHQKKDLYDILNKYSYIECYFDNDQPGKECYQTISLLYAIATDKSEVYNQYNDYNEYITQSKSIK